MNQTQRKFLIDSVKESSKTADEALKKSLPPEPDVTAFLLKALLTGDLKIHSREKLISVLLERAMKSPTSWMGRDSWMHTQKKFSFDITEFAELPEEYETLHREWEAACNAIEEQRRVLRASTKGLCTRIQLASSSTLSSMIAEIDDMGDISLMDMKLKNLLNGSVENKLIGDIEDA